MASYKNDIADETAALVRLLASSWTPAADAVATLLGTGFPFCWQGIELDLGCLLENPPGDMLREGEVDYLAGPLWPSVDVDLYRRAYLPRAIGCGPWTSHAAFQEYIGEGKLTWPLELPWIVGMEVKVSWVDSADELKSGKLSNQKQKTSRKQALRVARLGVDRALLLRILVVEPAEFCGIHEWILAGRRTHEPEKKVSDSLGHHSDDAFGTVVLVTAGIKGRPLELSGTMSGPVVLKAPTDNPIRLEPQAVEARRQLKLSLCNSMGRVDAPRQAPVTLLRCYTCQELFLDEGSSFTLDMRVRSPQCTKCKQKTD
jgi:hypothetical protein